MNKLLILFFLCFSLVFSLKGQTLVSMTTSKGEVIIKLYKETPKHRSNFIRLVQEKFYDSLLFHRVMKDFMIQAGDPQSKNASRYKKLGAGGPGYTIDAEIKPQFIHKKGALAAAAYNPKQESSGSQFYVVVGSRFPRKYLGKYEKENGVKYTEKHRIAYETLGGTPHLDGLYTVFGEVMKGLDIVESICSVETNGAQRPKKDIYIIKMKVIK